MPETKPQKLYLSAGDMKRRLQAILHEHSSRDEAIHCLNRWATDEEFVRGELLDCLERWKTSHPGMTPDERQVDCRYWRVALDSDSSPPLNVRFEHDFGPDIGQQTIAFKLAGYDGREVWYIADTLE